MRLFPKLFRLAKINMKRLRKNFPLRIARSCYSQQLASIVVCSWADFGGGLFKTSRTLSDKHPGRFFCLTTSRWRCVRSSQSSWDRCMCRLEIAAQNLAFGQGWLPFRPSRRHRISSKMKTGIFFGRLETKWPKTCAMLFTVSWGGTLIMSMENIVQQLDKEIADLTRARALLLNLSGKSSGLNSASGRTGKRIISASARRRMAAAQKARWAKYRATKKAS